MMLRMAHVVCDCSDEDYPAPPLVSSYCPTFHRNYGMLDVLGDDEGS